MRRYELTSPKFSGSVIYSFDDGGHLTGVDMSSVPFEETIWRAVWGHLPADPQSVNAVKGRTGTVREIREEVTFGMFWDRYDDKLNSSRKRTLAKWNRMPECDRRAAYYHIPKYFAAIPPGVRKKYAETYLNSELWNN